MLAREYTPPLHKMSQARRQKVVNNSNTPKILRKVALPLCWSRLVFYFGAAPKDEGASCNTKLLNNYFCFVGEMVIRFLISHNGSEKFFTHGCAILVQLSHWLRRSNNTFCKYIVSLLLVWVLKHRAFKQTKNAWRLLYISKKRLRITKQAITTPTDVLWSIIQVHTLSWLAT